MSAKAAILVAGGSGTRMGSEVPKQFMLLNHKPMLMYTLERFRSYDTAMKIVLVLPEQQVHYWKQMCAQYNFSIAYTLVHGGESRYHSVQNGLAQIGNEFECVAVHDGVRPLVSKETIANCFELAQKEGSAVPVIELKDSLRRLIDSGSKTVDRNTFRLVQTPQVFQTDILKKAYERPYHAQITDDASLVEEAGFVINLCKGNDENIKITSPADLVWAETLLMQQNYKP